MSTPAKPRKAYRTEWIERWCPPKPLVGIRPVEKVLGRHTATACPESRLVVAVITLAINDSLSPGNKRQRREARHFLLGPRLEEWCDLVGLNPEFVRFVAQRAGYLADEKTHWQKVPIKVRIEVEAVPEPATPTTKNSGEPLHVGL